MKKNMKKFGFLLTGFFSFLIITQSFSQNKVLDSLSLEFELPYYLKGECISTNFQHFKNRKKIPSDSLVFVYYDRFQNGKYGGIIPAYHPVSKDAIIEIKNFSFSKVKNNLYKISLLFLRPGKGGLSINLFGGSTGPDGVYFSFEILEPIFFDQ